MQAPTSLNSWNAGMVLSRYVICTIIGLWHFHSFQKQLVTALVLSGLLTTAVSACRRDLCPIHFRKRSSILHPEILVQAIQESKCPLHHQLQFPGENKTKHHTTPPKNLKKVMLWERNILKNKSQPQLTSCGRALAKVVFHFSAPALKIFFTNTNICWKCLASVRRNLLQLFTLFTAPFIPFTLAWKKLRPYPSKQAINPANKLYSL